MDAAHFAADLLDKIGVTVGGSGPADIHIHDDRFYKRVIRDRELGLGEAYQEGWWTANRLDEFLAVAQETNLADHVKPSPALLKLALQSRFGNRQDEKKAKKNAQAHYDIGNDLFERMLDKRMIYTCAYWRDAENLDAAQEAKLDLICRKLGLEPGMRLLDIGCGWGGFAQFAASRYDVQVTGISPAIEQVTLARENTVGLPVTILQKDYREMEGEFDRITSIGMMEHVGPRNLGTFFETCDSPRRRRDDAASHHRVERVEDPHRSVVRQVHLSRWCAAVTGPDLPSGGEGLVDRGRAQLRTRLRPHAHGVARQHQRALGRDPAVWRPLQADVGVLPARIVCRQTRAGDAAVPARVHESEAAPSRVRGDSLIATT